MAAALLNNVGQQHLVTTSHVRHLYVSKACLHIFEVVLFSCKFYGHFKMRCWKKDDKLLVFITMLRSSESVHMIRYIKNTSDLWNWRIISCYIALCHHVMVRPRFADRDGLLMWRLLWIYGISSRGQPLYGGPPGCEFDERLTTTHLIKLACYEVCRNWTDIWDDLGNVKWVWNVEHGMLGFCTGRSTENGRKWNGKA